MTKIPDIAYAAKENDFKLLRQEVVAKRQSGVLMEDITETILSEVATRIDAGDLTGADAVLFHAVHAGVRPSMLFTECRKAYNP